QVETSEVFCSHLPCAQLRKVIAATLGRHTGTGIRCLAHVPVAGAGGVHLHLPDQPGLMQFVPEHTFGGGRTADIAETNEQDAHQAPSRRRTRSRSSWVSTPAGGASRASATWMRTPCQSARSCSRHSVSSSQHGPQATKSCRKPAR